LFLGAKIDLVSRVLAFGVEHKVGDIFTYYLLPNLGLYSWENHAQTSSTPSGRESGASAQLDIGVRPLWLGDQQSRRWELRGTAQGWKDFQVTGPLTKQSYHNYVASITYRFYDQPTGEAKTKQSLQPSVALRRVIGENPEQGQPRQVFTELSFQLKY
jgi:hypothetical protein